MHVRHSIVLLSWLALACASGSAVAEERDPMRRVSFQASSEREVANDWITVTLGVTDEDADPSALADRVNQTMAWALDQARSEKALKLRSGGYSTTPVYDDRRIRRWRASQQLIVEGADFEAATALAGRLQSRIQLQGMSFSVSPERQREIEDELVDEALRAFRARADRVRKTLDASGYEIVRLDLQTGGTRPPPQTRVRALAEAAAFTPPAAEGGSSRLSVGVSATIELD